MKKPNKQVNRRDKVQQRQAKLDKRKRQGNANRALKGMKILQGGFPKGFSMTDKQKEIAEARKEFRSEKKNKNQ